MLCCRRGNETSFNAYKDLTSSTNSIRSLHSEPRIGTNLCVIRRSNVLLTFYLPLYVAFLSIGAVIFGIMERDLEKDIKSNLTNYLEVFKNQHPCVTDNDLEDLLRVVLTSKDKGVSALQNASESNWSFGQGLLFITTIVTTIGYGHVHPVTEAGKIFCIFYGMLGIPMTFILLTALCERFLRPTLWLLDQMILRLEGFYKILTIRTFHLIVVTFVSFVFFLVVPGAIFAYIEPGWHFLDGVYYCFISLCTIGLGDYIPGDAINQHNRTLYKVGITAYLLIGLTVVVMVLHLYDDIPELNLGSFLLRSSDPDDALEDSERVRLNAETISRLPKYSQETSFRNPTGDEISPPESPTMNERQNR